MYIVPPGAPFDERGGRLRGLFDLAAGHYPAFLFGFGVGSLLPVFHFHQVTADTLEPAFRYLAENDYRTVVSDDVARFVREGRHPGPRTVMLAFDDAWASLWLVAGPLLEQYDLRAVSYVIPGRVQDAAATRPTISDGPVDAAAADGADNPFATWPELRALSASGRVDVQSHTWSHAMIFSGPKVIGAVDSQFGHEPLLLYPRLDRGRAPEFLQPARLGHPLFARRSRMSDAHRFFPDAEACARAEAKVQTAGELSPPLEAIPGRSETDTERDNDIEQELAFAKEEIERRTGTPVRHVCLPWGVTGSATRAAVERVGMVTAFANRLPGRMAVAAGDDPYFLKRLDNRYIFALPGTGRRTFTALV